MKAPLLALAYACSLPIAHGVTITLGDQTLNAGSNDGWSSNMHVLSNTDGLGPGGEMYQYTNDSGGAEVITPTSWSYYIQGGEGPDFTSFNVTPFLVRVDTAIEPPSYTVFAIGETRVGGEDADFNATGEFTSDFAGEDAEPFTLQDGETIAIGVIDSNADGSGPAHLPAGGIIPFDGAAGGDNNHWYGGNSAQNTYPQGTPGGVGIGGILNAGEAADINRNYQFNLTFETAAAEDQDGDGMGDAYEEANGLNPLVDDSLLDLDGDGVNNITEFNNGTKPNDRDSDGDTLEDGWESNTGTWVNSMDTGTNPLVQDSDGDTLRDDVENCTLIFVDGSNPGTDPNKFDTDEDGLGDAAEIAMSTDPTDPLDPAPPSGAVITLGDLTLNSGSNDGWSSNLHVLSNTDGLGPGGEFYQYTNDTGGPQFVTPVSWNYYVQGPGGGDINTFIVTPFLVKVINGIEPPEYEVAAIGASRLGGVDYSEPGEATSEWGNDEGFTLDDGETVAIGVIDANPDGTGSSVNGIIPFDGGAGGDNNHWYGGNSAQDTYPQGTPAGVGIGGTLTGNESANIDRNYQFNITLEFGAQAGLMITDFTHNPTTGETSMTWNSKEGRTYGVFFSLDCADWSADIDDGVSSGGDSTTIEFNVNDFAAGASELFFRVEQNP